MSEVQAAGYGWQEAAPPHSCAYLAPVVSRVLVGLGARRVLDLGAGNGSLCGELHRTGFDVVGVEHDQGGVEIARRAVPPVPFYRCSVEDDPDVLMRTERHFDAVVSTEVIEHLYAPDRLAVYAHAALSEGGHLVVTTPFHGYWKNLALSIAGAWDRHHTVLWNGGHVKFFSRRTLTELLDRNGFDVVRFIGIGRVPWLWKSMLIVARKRG